MDPPATALPLFGPPRFHLATQGQASYDASAGSPRGCSNNSNSAPPPAAERLTTDLESRLASRPQITTDGLRSYIWGVERAFGANVDYGMVIKSYAEEDGRLVLTGAGPKPISGRLDPWHISTSCPERNNPNCRTFLRRLTRLTNAFSKKLENLAASPWLYFAHYNFVRTHGTLRVTPAMAAGVTDHIWSAEELLNAAPWTGA